MSYLKPDEFIMPIDFGTYYPAIAMTDDDMRRLYDAGIRTLNGYVVWDLIEHADGSLDWGYLDEWIGRVQSAGLKAAINCYEFPRADHAEAWYMRDCNGHLFRDRWQPRMQVNDYHEFVLLSPWHSAARAKHFWICEEVLRRYQSQALVCCTGPVHGGEMVLPHHVPSYYDEAALAAFRAFSGVAQALPSRDPLADPLTKTWLAQTLIDFYVAQARLFYTYTGESWTMFHRHFLAYARSCAWLIDDLHRAIQQALPQAERWGVCYAAYRPGVSNANSGEIDQHQHGIQMLVGAEGPDGLRRNTQHAINSGVRGFVMGLLLPYSHRLKSEPWMFADIKWSLAQWRTQRAG